MPSVAAVEVCSAWARRTLAALLLLSQLALMRSEVQPVTRECPRGAQGQWTRPSTAKVKGSAEGPSGQLGGNWVQ